MQKYVIFLNIYFLYHCHFIDKDRGAAHRICNLRYNVPNEIPVVFHNGSNYDYHFIIKKLANELRNNLNVLAKTQKSTKLFQFQ